MFVILVAFLISAFCVLLDKFTIFPTKLNIDVLLPTAKINDCITLLITRPRSISYYYIFPCGTCKDKREKFGYPV